MQLIVHVRAPGPTLLASVPVLLHVFDVLHLDGRSTTELPYTRRRELLAELGLLDDTIRVPPHFVDVDGAQLLAAADAYGLEGVVAKRLASLYQPGRRSPDWIKVPIARTQEVVVIGYKPGGGRREGTVGSLVLAVHTPTGELTFAGGVGTGFTGAMLARLHEQLVPLHRSTPPTSVPREHARGVHWVEPVLVGEVAFRNWTPDGRLRHPSWRGVRSDRRPHETVRQLDEPHVVSALRPGNLPPQVAGAMQTSDGRWRVEVVDNGSARWYRLVHNEDTVDWLSLPDVERLLDRAGIDMGRLRDAGDVA